MRPTTASRLVLSLAIASALSISLTACGGGGGGGNVRPTPSTPPSTPTGGTGGSGGGSSGGTGGGTPPPTTYTYPEYNHLVPTGALEAQKAGFTGKGVTIGVLDSGVDEALAPLATNVVSFKSYISGGNQSPNDDYGHGSEIEQTMAGAAAGGFVGGVAPDAKLAVAQVCDTAGNCAGYSQAYIDLTAAGVKLFNQSFGADYDPTNTAFTSYNGSQMQAQYQPMVDAGSLFVWSAGNEGPTKLNFEAAVSSYEPTLQKGWLSVVNVQIDSNGNPTTLDSTSAACGISEMWCLAAPGTNQVLGVSGTVYSSGLGTGTSGAAAVVSGVAALVWQAFPWMTGTDVQQTILTTATPLGGSAPNPTYGWGEVNAAKAVYGPAQFAFGEFDANIGASDSTFGNAISGSGSLALTGTTGTLTLAAANTYTGGTSINSATLAVTGSLASDVTVAGGALSGTGTINGNVTNTGGTVISAGGTGQQLSITGNYAAGSSAQTAISLGNPLKVGGTATVGGTLQILAPASTYTPSSTETLLTAGSLSGTFANQTYGTGVYYKVSGLTYGATALTADVTREAVVQSIPLNTATTNVAHGLDTALNTADKFASTPASYAAHSEFLGSAAQFLSARTQAAALTSVASLNGEIYGTSNAIEAQQSQVTDDAIAVHQNSLVAPSVKPGVWVQALGSSGGLSQSSFASAKYTMGGALMGLDSTLFGDPQFTVGAAFGHTAMNADLAGLAGHANGRADTFAVYGRAGFGNGGYVAGRASWTSGQMDVHRAALLGGTAATVTGSRTDDLYRGTLELGKALTAGQGTITPYLSVTGLRLDTDGFTENGAGGFGLAVTSQHHTASFASLGARFGHGFSWSGGQGVLTGYLAWRHTLSGMKLGLDARFVGAPGSDFEAIGQGLARSTGTIGATLSTQVNGRWSWYINAAAEGARGREHDVTANAGIAYRF